ncbi:DUF374 domain-containing protein [Asaia astilbis]|uniref:DUF374 domain-containing protein n=1 Tax=Asaia astilbis TaxID=610244 RepID=UPI001E3C80E0|nr:DUF374 domain-containing protein [Asaia astilbis]
MILARGYVDLTIRTTRWTVTGASEALPSLLQKSDRSANGCITVAWHRTLLMLPAMCRWAHTLKPELKITVMVSRNRDGQFIGDLIAPWGITGIEGSSDRNGKNKGGSRALRQACSVLRDGAIFAITPDGPRGPAETVQPGAEASCAWQAHHWYRSVPHARASPCPAGTGFVCPFLSVGAIFFMEPPARSRLPPKKSAKN